MSTRVVNVRHEKPDIFIGRPSPWGNPFVIGRDGTREEVIAKYRVWITQSPQRLNSVSLLKGKSLGCFCFPLACHGDVLVELAEAAQ